MHTLTSVGFVLMAFVQRLHLISHLDFRFPLIPTHLLFFYTVKSKAQCLLLILNPIKNHVHSALPAGPHFHPYSPGLLCPWPVGTIQLLSTPVEKPQLDGFAYER